MGKEYETKVLEINVKEMDAKLLALGARKQPELSMKRWIFPMKSDKQSWIRLRTDGKITTLTYKRKTGFGISETEELEVRVDDFEETKEILSKLNLDTPQYQETKRTVYLLGDIEFSIDTWPRIPVFLEVESTSERKVKQGLKMLGLTGKDVGNLSAREVFSRYGINLASIKVLKL